VVVAGGDGGKARLLAGKVASLVKPVRISLEISVAIAAGSGEFEGWADVFLNLAIATNHCLLFTIREVSVPIND
jgi:hypothetical protein